MFQCVALETQTLNVQGGPCLLYGPNVKLQQSLMKTGRSIKWLSQLIYLIVTHVMFFSLTVRILILDQTKLTLLTKSCFGPTTTMCNSSLNYNDNSMGKSDLIITKWANRRISSSPFSSNSKLYRFNTHYLKPKNNNNNMPFLSIKSNPIIYITYHEQSK